MNNNKQVSSDTPLVFNEDAYLIDGDDPQTLVIFAHGAGANMHSEFMDELAKGVAQSARVVRFNFPYMRDNAIDGKRRPPNRMPKLVEDFNQQINALKQEFNPSRVFLMGKSMGGRTAAIVAESGAVDGVICLGYPFIPLKGGEPRLEPLELCQAPVLIVQGDRDKLGSKEQVLQWPGFDVAKPVTHNGQAIELAWLTDGDHSFKPRVKSGTTLAANISAAIKLCQQFISIK